MPRLLLLVAFTLLPSLFVNSAELLPTLNYTPARRSPLIRGLLLTRQDTCDPGFNVCEVVGCCPTDWNCCSDSNCCAPQTNCELASNGIIGCCPDGEVCTGPVGGPTTINEPPPPNTDTLPATLPPSTPTVVNSVPIPTTPTAVNTVPVPTTPTFNSVPLPTEPTVAPTVVPTTNVPLTQTTISDLPTAATTQSPATTSNSPLVASAAGQAQLHRPLLVLVGILLAAIH